jgi:hypothetical protein
VETSADMNAQTHLFFFPLHVVECTCLIVFHFSFIFIQRSSYLGFMVISAYKLGNNSFATVCFIFNFIK